MHYLTIIWHYLCNGAQTTYECNYFETEIINESERLPHLSSLIVAIATDVN